MSVPTVPAGETWTHYVISNYHGLVAFLVMDAVIFIGSATLLSVQATQVRLSSCCYWYYGLYPV